MYYPPSCQTQFVKKEAITTDKSNRAVKLEQLLTEVQLAARVMSTDSHVTNVPYHD